MLFEKRNESTADGVFVFVFYMIVLMHKCMPIST